MNDSTSRPPRTRKTRVFTFGRICMAVLAVLVILVVVAAVFPAKRWAHGTGYVITDREVELHPSVEGVIARWVKSTGEDVEAGGVVIQLNDAVQRAALEEARGRMTAQSTSLKSLQSRQQLDEAQRQEQIKQSQMNLELARSQHERIMGRAGFSPKEIEEAELRVQLASSRLAELSLPREELRQLEIEVLEQQILASQKQIDRLEAEVALHKIVSPIAGTVHLHRFEPGEVVKPEHVLGQVFDRGAWVVKLQVAERMLPYVVEGQTAKIDLSVLNRLPFQDYLQGTVTRIDPVVTPRSTGDGIFLVELSIDPPEGLTLQPGMTAWADIDAGKTTWLWRILGM